MSATGSGYEVRPVPERAGALRERAGEVGAAAGQRVAEIRDVTAERLRDAGRSLGNVANQVEVEQFILRGNIAEHPFRIEIEGEEPDRYLVFEFNFRSDDGDTVRFTGRKHLGGAMGAGGLPETGSLPEGASLQERTSVSGSIETRGGP